MGLGHIMSLVSSVEKSWMLLKRYHWRWAERPGERTRGGGVWGTAPAFPTKTGSICMWPSPHPWPDERRKSGDTA